MSFQILDYLDELERYGKLTHKPTWIHGTCPVCGGKLKINKNPTKYGAYACYTNNCHEKGSNLIRQKLYKKKPFSKSTAFKPTSARKVNLVEIVTPIYPVSNPDDFITNVPFNPPKQIKYSDKVFTYFQYEGFTIVRLDTRLNDGTRKKYMYPEYTLPNGMVVKGLPTRLENLPIYTSSYLQSSMVFAEGEKTASIGQKLGIATVTFPTFGFSERYVDKYAQELRGKGLTNVLYLADNDVTGEKKADLISTYFWKNDIRTKVCNLVDVFTEYKEEEGFDLYDAYKLNLINKDNTLSVLEDLLLL